MSYDNGEAKQAALNRERMIRAREFLDLLIVSDTVWTDWAKFARIVEDDTAVTQSIGELRLRRR